MYDYPFAKVAQLTDLAEDPMAVCGLCGALVPDWALHARGTRRPPGERDGRRVLGRDAGGAFRAGLEPRLAVEEVTPAETLTAAAAKLKRLASDATPGKWECDEVGDIVVRTSATDCLFVAEAGANGAPTRDAAYIAAMNPAVGLALAEALEAEGRRMGGWIPIGIDGSPLHTADPHLLAIATEILNEGENT